MKSLFSKLYSYRQQEKRNQRENFLTEIFAYCLQEDEAFRTEVLQKITTCFLGVPTITTQSTYIEGRPDIEIIWKDDGGLILIECKIDSAEGPKQLERYQQILKRSKAKVKKLVYLTKYPEIKNGEVIYLRWFEIKELINTRHQPFTQQLKIYLEERNMSKVDNFSIEDETAVVNIGKVIEKMEVVLNPCSDYFLKKTEWKCRDERRNRLNKLFSMNSYHDYKWLTYTGVTDERLRFLIRLGFKIQGDSLRMFYSCFIPENVVKSQAGKQFTKNLLEKLEMNSQGIKDKRLEIGWSESILNNSILEQRETMQSWIDKFFDTITSLEEQE